MAHIRIDYDGLMQQAAALGNISSSYESLNARLRSMEQNITAGWEGKASRAFSHMMLRYIEQAVKMKGIIDEIKGYATKASTLFNDVDRSCATSIRNSF